MKTSSSIGPVHRTALAGMLAVGLTSAGYAGNIEYCLDACLNAESYCNTACDAANDQAQRDLDAWKVNCNWSITMQVELANANCDTMGNPTDIAGCRALVSSVEIDARRDCDAAESHFDVGVCKDDCTNVAEDCFAPCVVYC